MESKQGEKFIPRELLLTPKEHEPIGGTTEEGDWPEDIPFGLNQGMSIEEIAAGRKRLASYPDSFIGYGLGYGRPVVIQFSEIDPEDGHVLGEPKFIGFWDSGAKKVILAEDPEKFDAEVKVKLAKFKKGK